jgi:hypothetical protein
MPHGSGFDQWILNKTARGLVGGVGAGPSQKISAAARSLVVPDSRSSRRGALPQRILR